MSPAIQLTPKDFSILETMLERRVGSDDPLIPILRAKLDTAQVVFREDLAPGTIALNCRIVFCVNRKEPQTRIVVQNDHDFFEGRTLSICSVRGLSLIGLREGQRLSIRNEDGESEDIDILEVRDHRMSFLGAPDDANVTPLWARRAPPVRDPGDEDPDPGPAAA